MDERLKLAEAYYATARDLDSHGRHFIEVAAMLSSMADRMCELSISDKRERPRSLEERQPNSTRHDAGSNPAGDAITPSCCGMGAAVRAEICPLQAGPAEVPSTGSAPVEGQPDSAGDGT